MTAATAPTTLDLDHLRGWIGKTTEASDIVTAQLVKGLRATLFLEIGEPRAGDDLVELHWFEPDVLPPPAELAFTHYPEVLSAALGPVPQ